MKRVGGPTVAKTVYNTLRRLLCGEVAKLYRLTDASNKKPFGATKLADAIRGGFPYLLLHYF